MIDALERFARDFPAGSVLFEEGQPGDYMYVVLAGEVEIRRQVGETERVLAVLPPGEFFGEMAILNGRPRSATAVVRTGARLLVIEGRTFEAMLRARPEIALRIIKSLATRLESANQHVELLLLPSANHRVVQCMRHMAEEQMTLAGAQFNAGTAILVPKRIEDIAGRVGLPVHEVIDVVDRLRSARLVLLAEDAGIEGDGFIVPEVGRLLEFLEFLNLKDRFGG
ncbi:MAG: Crp/Fnr family transcriptional regulator [Deltaproteobacteria bacterium]|nr:Crp/Fnr family transcriptional regulator [Deltaproteobacteria bacterium]MDQ3299918.1 Crp/Fnr family transcriptional regulator [Myxococcota bacterium]